ncbi:MAG: hypothetical protein MH186_04080 [Marinobacter sp.]|nr:hypothetical protein [Marinobacter sp.]
MATGAETAKWHLASVIPGIRQAIAKHKNVVKRQRTGEGQAAGKNDRCGKNDAFKQRDGSGLSGHEVHLFYYQAPTKKLAVTRDWVASNKQAKVKPFHGEWSENNRLVRELQIF